MAETVGKTREHAHRRRLPGAVLLAATLAVAACGTQEDTGASPTPTTPAVTSAAASRTPNTSPGTNGSPSCELPGGAQQAQYLRWDGSFVRLSSMVGKEVRMGDHDRNGECFERVVFQLNGKVKGQGELPGVHARYVEPPIRHDPSDQAVQVAGNAFLQVTIGSWMYGMGGASGPSRLGGLGLERVTEAVMTSNYEGMTTWTIGLDKERDFVLGQVVGTAACPGACITIDVEG